MSYSLSEAAKQIGVHPETLRTWADEGKIECIRTPGGHRRFSQKDIELIKEQRNEQRG